ncbi:unnamed protein product [Didymodactylos carnosus]|uniref:Uncharacterized protein n=1 Tax=Didymodactylos carnosus TaxID=1234261 RepID=A0A8S2JNW5_9BILA|nr:unnamed protein product [Didymodactylos carnosus]CAF3807855.1 unnamed protein product [Didymodactylos carnosus]
MAYSYNAIDSAVDDIRENAKAAVNDMERYSKQRAHREPVDVYEEVLLHKTQVLEATVQERVQSIREFVKNRRPDPNEWNYQQKADQYTKFVKHATTGLTSLRSTFKTLFSKLVEVVKRIARWIRDNLPNILSAIASIFRDIVLPLLEIFDLFIHTEVVHLSRNMSKASKSVDHGAVKKPIQPPTQIENYKEHQAEKSKQDGKKPMLEKDDMTKFTSSDIQSTSVSTPSLYCPTHEQEKLASNQGQMQTQRSLYRPRPEQEKLVIDHGQKQTQPLSLPAKIDAHAKQEAGSIVHGENNSSGSATGTITVSILCLIFLFF